MQPLFEMMDTSMVGDLSWWGWGAGVLGGESTRAQMQWIL